MRGTVRPVRHIRGSKWDNPSRVAFEECKYLEVVPQERSDWLLYTVGRLTFPRAPEITYARAHDGGQVSVW